MQHVHQSRDPSLYQLLLSAYEQASAPQSGSDGLQLPSPMELAPLDTKWVDEVVGKNQAERVKLEVELKTYSNNMIKESIRVCGFAVLAALARSFIHIARRWGIAIWRISIAQSGIIPLP